MRRAYPLTINEAIDIRQVMHNIASSYPLAYVRPAWVGMCKEIVEALYGSEDHEVVRHNGRLYIWRKGYEDPHFIEVGGGAFCCPYWNYARKND